MDGALTTVALPAALAIIMFGLGLPLTVQEGPSATSMEIGIHNGTLAITIAVSVLGSVQMSIPAAVYSIVMFPAATLVGRIVSRGVREPVIVRSAA